MAAGSWQLAGRAGLRPGGFAFLPSRAALFAVPKNQKSSLSSSSSDQRREENDDPLPLLSCL